MKKTIAIVTISLALMSSAAMAQERTGDAALGALSGALVLGPVGAVAGAIVGYTRGTVDCECLGSKTIKLPPEAGGATECRLQILCAAKRILCGNASTGGAAVCFNNRIRSTTGPAAGVSPRSGKT